MTNVSAEIVERAAAHAVETRVEDRLGAAPLAVEYDDIRPNF
jgi:hypothetical protein